MQLGLFITNMQKFIRIRRKITAFHLCYTNISKSMETTSTSELDRETLPATPLDMCEATAFCDRTRCDSYMQLLANIQARASVTICYLITKTCFNLTVNICISAHTEVVKIFTYEGYYYTWKKKKKKKFRSTSEYNWHGLQLNCLKVCENIAKKPQVTVSTYVLEILR